MIRIIGVLSMGVTATVLAGGCVSQATHQQIVEELQQVRQESARQAMEDEKRLAESRQENQRIADRLEEVEQGKITIQQIRDRLRITVVDQVLFESGSDEITEEGKEILNKVGSALRGVRDREIHISGHTDNIQIGPSLRGRFTTNWELSTLRATSVIRYLVDHAGISPHLLTAVGHAYTRPVADNDSDEGRSQNRRIEITLYPKDLKNITAEFER